MPWIAGGAVAAVLILAAGWLLGRGSMGRGPEVASVNPPVKSLQKAPDKKPLPPPEKVADDRPGQLAIVVRIMKHNNQLAGAYDFEEQMRVFESMSDDLKTELLRLVHQGSPEEANAVADLYGMVVRDGLLPRAARLPTDKKDDAAGRLARHFRKTVAEIDAQLRPEGSPGKDVLSRLKATAQDATAQLEGKGNTTVARPADASLESRPLLQSLIVRGLTLASETDPLTRADLCSELATRVAPSVILLSVGAGSDKADLVGDCLNDLLERGVAGNLEKLERERGKDAAPDEAAKVRERTTKAWNALEADLADVPGEHRDDVQRVIGASAPGRDRVAFPGKGKGLQKKQGDDKFLPPGLQKKGLNKSSLGPADRRLHEFETPRIVRLRNATADNPPAARLDRVDEIPRG